VRAVLPGPAEQREHAGLARTPAVDAQADTEEEEEEEVVASAAAEGAEEEQRGQGGQEEADVSLAVAGGGEPLPALEDAAAAALPPPSSSSPPGLPGTTTAALGSGDGPLHHLMAAARTQSTSTISLDSDVTVSVGRPFSLWKRSILTDISLTCHAWSCREKC
jgi:hypothetical protein